MSSGCSIAFGFPSEARKQIFTGSKTHSFNFSGSKKQIYRNGQITAVHDSPLFNSSHCYSIIINMEEIQHSCWKGM